MKTFRVTKISTGEFITEYVSEAPLVDPDNPITDPTQYKTEVVWTSEDPHQPIPEYIPPRLITKLAFRNRFTPEEKVTIEIASLDNPTADIQQRSLAAMLRANKEDISVAEYVNLDLPMTRTGVMALEQYGLLSKGRSLEILDAPIQQDEMLNG